MPEPDGLEPCPQCGQPAADIELVEEYRSDPDTGYRNSERMCGECLKEVGLQ